MAPLALGTDTGGSIRIPASYCGVTGLKPTLGRLPASGLLGLAPTLDAVGPMARTAADVAVLLHALSPPDAIREQRPLSSSASRPLDGIRLGVARSWFCEVLADDTASSFEEALNVLGGLGATVTAVEIPLAEHGAPLSWLITMSEATKTYAGVPRDEMTSTFRRRLEIGDRIDDHTYVEALRARRALTTEVTKCVAGFDAVVVPATVSPAPRLDHLDALVAGVAVTWPDVSARTMALWNVTGLPSVSVPTGFNAGGLPLGMQIVGAPFADERCLAIAAAYQTATEHHLVTPNLPSVPSAPRR